MKNFQTSSTVREVSRLRAVVNSSGRLIDRAEGLFTFEEPAPGKTTIVWKYTFYTRTFVGGLAFAPVVKLKWHSYIGECLGRLTALAEERIPANRT